MHNRNIIQISQQPSRGGAHSLIQFTEVSESLDNLSNVIAAGKRQI